MTDEETMQLEQATYSIERLADAFTRLADAAKMSLSDVEMIAAIRENPSLTYAQKIALIRKVRNKY